MKAKAAFYIIIDNACIFLIFVCGNRIYFLNPSLLSGKKADQDQHSDICRMRKSRAIARLFVAPQGAHCYQSRLATRDHSHCSSFGFRPNPYAEARDSGSPEDDACPKWPLAGFAFGRTKPGQYLQISYGRACGADRGPFPSPDANELRRRPEQPSDNRPAGPTFRGIHPASCCNGSSGGASAT